MTIAFVDFESGYNSAAAGTIAASAGNHLEGSLLVSHINSWGMTQGETVTGVADTEGNTYYLAQRSTVVSDEFGSHEIWYAYDISANASNVVTATYSDTTIQYREIAVHQYSGDWTSDPVDGGNIDDGNSTALATVADTTTIADAVLSAGWAIYDTGTGTPGSSYSTRYDGTYQYTEDRIVSSTGSYNATATYSASALWTGAHAAFGETSPAGGLVGRRASSRGIVRGVARGIG